MGAAAGTVKHPQATLDYSEAMIESEVGEEQVQKMLMKYWDLRPSEVKEIYEMSKNNYARSQR